MGWFSGLGLGSSATGLPKNTKTSRNVPKHTKTYQKVAEEEAFRNETQVFLFGVFGGRFFCFHFGLLFVGEA
jgi:hypothetical protein